MNRLDITEWFAGWEDWIYDPSNTNRPKELVQCWIDEPTHSFFAIFKFDGEHKLLEIAEDELPYEGEDPDIRELRPVNAETVTLWVKPDGQVVPGQGR